MTAIESRSTNACNRIVKRKGNLHFNPMVIIYKMLCSMAWIEKLKNHLSSNEQCSFNINNFEWNYVLALENHEPCSTPTNSLIVGHIDWMASSCCRVPHSYSMNEMNEIFLLFFLRYWSMHGNNRLKAKNSKIVKPFCH